MSVTYEGGHILAEMKSGQTMIIKVEQQAPGQGKWF